MESDNSRLVLPRQHLSSLTRENYASSFSTMNFGDRLRAAREYAKLTQEQLEEKSSVKQGTISKIERGESDSSTFVVKLATACGVRPEWLDSEDGPMVDNSLRIDDPQIEAIARLLMQMRAPYLVERVRKELDADIELIERARTDTKRA